MTAFLLQQKIAKKDGAQIDRNRDIEHLWKFYQRYRRNNRVDDLQREEQRLRESGTFSTNFREYVFYVLPSSIIHCEGLTALDGRGKLFSVLRNLLIHLEG